jgi:SAM-dependent methyltransferase
MSAEGYYKSGDLIGSFLRNKRNGMVLKNLTGRALDVACGDNILIKMYGKEGTGIDIENYGNADEIVKNFSSMPFKNETFDSVSVVGSLNYFENPVTVLQEINRVMKKDGKLLVTMPNYFIMQLWHRIREPWAHKSGYSRQQLSAMFLDAGFRIKETKGFLMGLNRLYIVVKS